MGNTVYTQPQSIKSYQQGLSSVILKSNQPFPDPLYASPAKRQVYLLPQVETVLKQQLSKKPLEINLDSISQQYPTFYIVYRQVYYQGQWKNGRPNGKGKIYFPSGSYFEGTFIDGQAEGKDCILVLPDGSFYRGQIKQSIISGRGKFVKNSFKYEGDWVNGKPHGKGLQVYSDGNSYNGQFYNGIKSGKGIFKWKDQIIYEGQFDQGVLNGKGKLTALKDQTFSDQTFSGIFKNNQKIGTAKIVTSIGSYEGQTSGRGPHGYGIFKWNTGQIYKGEFKNGFPDGKGVLYNDFGEKLQGQWKQGELINEVIDRQKNRQQQYKF